MSNRKMYRKMAKQHRVSVDKMKKDMQAAINYAYQNRVPHDGAVPNVDEFISHAVQEVKKWEKE